MLATRLTVLDVTAPMMRCHREYSKHEQVTKETSMMISLHAVHFIESTSTQKLTPITESLDLRGWRAERVIYMGLMLGLCLLYSVGS